MPSAPGLTHAIVKSLRRFESEDLLVLIIALSGLWITIDKLHAWLAHAAGGTLAPPFGLLYLPLALLLTGVWLVWGYETRVQLEHRWPLLWRLLRGVTKWATHSIPEAIFEFFQEDKGELGEVRYPLTLTFPATLKDKIDAHRIARQRWHGETPSLFADLEWHFRNPNTMAIVRDARNTAVGYFDFAPVTPAFVDQLRHGMLDEFDLADHMLADDDSGSSLRAARYVYVAGLASIKPDSPWEETRIGAFLHWSMARLLCQAVFSFDDTRLVTFVAVAFGPGARFCRRAGMVETGSVVLDGDPAHKPHGLYEITMSLGGALLTSMRLQHILTDEYPGGLYVDTLRSTPSKQIYVLDRRASRHDGHR